jgi:GAF domain-containing protein
MATEVDERLASEIAEVARLLEDDDNHTVMVRLVRLAVDLVPSCDEAGLTVFAADGRKTVEVTDPAVRRCHDEQFAAGHGPVVEALDFREPRRVDDARTERRWLRFRATAQREGLLSCLALPVSTAPGYPSAAIAFYARAPQAFCEGSHDIALLFAALGGTALRNVTLYSHSQRLIQNLRRALVSRATIDQATGILMAQRRVSPEEAFQILITASQNYNVRLAEIARRIVASTESGAASRPERPKQA